METGNAMEADPMAKVIQAIRRAEVLTEITFLQAVAARPNVEDSFQAFVEALSGFGREVPRFGLSSHSWGEFLGECEEDGLIRANGSLELTKLGRGRLENLIWEAKELNLDLGYLGPLQRETAGVSAR